MVLFSIPLTKYNTESVNQGVELLKAILPIVPSHLFSVLLSCQPITLQRWNTEDQDGDGEMSPFRLKIDSFPDYRNLLVLQFESFTSLLIHSSPEMNKVSHNFH